MRKNFKEKQTLQEMSPPAVDNLFTTHRMQNQEKPFFQGFLHYAYFLDTCFVINFQ
jgi:hypothetical protein